MQNKQYRLEAGALSYALFLLLVSGILISALFLFANVVQNNQQQFIINQQLYDAIESGFTILKEDKEVFSEYQNVPLASADSIQISTMPWNVYKVGKVEVAKKRFNRAQSAFLTPFRAGDSIALFVEESNTKLQFVGDVTIKGDLHIGRMGYGRGNLGQAFQQGIQTVDGQTIINNELVPELNEVCQFFADIPIEQIPTLYEAEPLNEELFNQDHIHQPFTQNTLVYVMPANSRLTNVSMSGNIIIYSPGLLQIDRSVQLEDCWIIAPRIEIDDGWNATAHLLASQSIKIGRYVSMNYPSSVVVRPNKEFPEQLSTAISIAEHSLIEGSVILQNKPVYAPYHLVQVDDDATIEGELIVQGKLSFYGKVYGSLYAKELYYRLNSGIYKNYFINGTIDKQTQNPYFASSIQSQKEKPAIVVKWLD